MKSIELINSIRETNSMHNLGMSRLLWYTSQHFRFLRIEFIRSKLSIFSAHVSGVTDAADRSRGSRQKPGRQLTTDSGIDRAPEWPPAASSCTWNGLTMTPDTRAEKFESLERINSVREIDRDFDSCNSRKRLETSRLHELHESKLLSISRIEFIRSKLSIFSAHASGSMGIPCQAGAGRGRCSIYGGSFGPGVGSGAAGASGSVRCQGYEDG